MTRCLSNQARQTTRPATKPHTRIVKLGTGISWTAQFSVSPDEHRLLRIQEFESGDNLAWLYRLNAHHHVQRLDGKLGGQGFDCLPPSTKLPVDPYHTCHPT